MAPTPDASEFLKNLTRITTESQLILQTWAEKQATRTRTPGPDPLHIGGIMGEAFAKMAEDPAQAIEQQVRWWQDCTGLMQASMDRAFGHDIPPYVAADPKDRRFRDPAWQENAVFDFIRESYLLAARHIQDSIRDIKGLDPHDAHKLEFYTRQYVDAVSPSNFAMTNPEVLRATIESGGENLVRGLQHVLEDLERGKDGSLKISMTDENAFEFGKNIAVTPGKVIFQNDLMQLIQYTPTTKDVYKTPLLVIPAWINKYYILDLQPENSAVKAWVDEGYTVFVVSWVNPDASLGHKTFEDYLFEGPIAALDAIEAATGEKTVSAVGYCLGGTLLATLLAYLKATKRASRIKTATFLTTMVDFGDAGDLEVFIDDEQINALEARVNETGYLDGSDMGATFSLLRANDLIWSYVVNNYMLGKDPMPFDLLYWNADSTRMPAKMHVFYLRNMYQKNLLAQPGGITIDGVPIDLSIIDIPIYILSTREDHIAPWKTTYAATQIYKGDIRFVLSASGHIAGVVNPPAKKKYGFWTNAKLPKDPDKWFETAKETAGSWWSDWDKWQQNHNKTKAKPRIPGSGKLKPIEDAPGAYVTVKS